MSAEIAVMNKYAIALAADSAQTAFRSTGAKKDLKINNSANKLFMLSKCHPVGIMQCGNAQFMKIPWETIIKMYRSRLDKKKFKKLKDYSDDFINFLNTSKSIFKGAEETCINSTISFYLGFIKQQISKETTAISGDDLKKKAEIKRIVAEIVGSHYEQWGKESFIKTAGKEDLSHFIDLHGALVNNALKETFEEYHLDNKILTQLRTICASLFFKEDFSPSDSEIIIAGFGEDEVFPSLQQFKLECLIDGKLKYKEVGKQIVDFENEAVIARFAQGDMVHLFMEGIDWKLDKLSNDYLAEVFKTLPGVFIDPFKFKSEADKKKILDQALKLSMDTFEKYKNKMLDYRWEEFGKPVVDTVACLPKAELASVAEALVSLTSFRKKVTMVEETVGGPIDVAVISKGDGFVWIKRKHYFTPELNPHFFARE